MINPRKIPLNKKICKENLLILKKVFDERNIPFFLGYGTLLGAVRDKNFIAWDTDIDLLFDKKNKLSVVQALPFLKEKGFVERGLRENFWGLNRKNNRVDIYFFSQRNIVDKFLDRVTCGYGFFCVEVDKFYWDEVVEFKWFGEKFLIFKNYEAWLSKVYGADWRVPQNKKGRAKTFTSHYAMGFLSFVKGKVPWEFGERVLAFYRLWVK